MYIHERAETLMWTNYATGVTFLVHGCNVRFYREPPNREYDIQ